MARGCPEWPIPFKPNTNTYTVDVYHGCMMPYLLFYIIILFKWLSVQIPYPLCSRENTFSFQKIICSYSFGSSRWILDEMLPAYYGSFSLPLLVSVNVYFLSLLLPSRTTLTGDYVRLCSHCVGSFVQSIHYKFL